MDGSRSWKFDSLFFIAALGMVACLLGLALCLYGLFVDPAPWGL